MNIDKNGVANLASDLVRRVNYISGLIGAIRKESAGLGLPLKNLGIKEDGLNSLEQGIGEFKRTLPSHLQ